MKLTPLDIMFTLISGAAHDIDHPGNNNLFEIKTRSKMALLYNDQAVLENHHCASLFFMLEDEKLNCLVNLSAKDKVDGRKMIVDNILATDNSKHGVLQGEIKGVAESPEDKQELSGKNKGLILKALVHAADIANPTRPFDIAKKWSIQIVKEFFNQGDKESALGLEISMLCDRHTTNFAKSQIGFANFMIMPYFSILHQMFPKLDTIKKQIGDNVEVYKTLTDEYET